MENDGAADLASIFSQMIKIVLPKRVALVYDRVNKWGGAERVLLALHKIFPNAPLYASVYNKKTAPWASVFDVKISFLQNFPKAKSSHEFYAPLMPIAFESFDFSDFDLVISVTSEAAKGIITKNNTLHVCICLTPTRYLWSGYNEYFNNSFLRTLSKPIISYLRKWDKIASLRPDFYIAISKEVQNRIKRYYWRESTVIYPPISIGAEVANKIFMSSERDKTQTFHKLIVSNRDSENFISSPRQSTKPYTLYPNNYFLIVSRLVPYKKIDLAVRVFNRLKLPLIIIGSGSMEKSLKRMAGPTINLLGNLTDEKLLEYYKGCKALVFPGKEDFGLTILEAQLLGKPVIAYKAGGALETVIEGKSGEFFETEESLFKIVKNFNTNKYKSEDCIENTEKFNFKRFEKELMEFLEEKLKEFKESIRIHSD